MIYKTYTQPISSAKAKSFSRSVTVYQQIISFNIYEAIHKDDLIQQREYLHLNDDEPYQLGKVSRYLFVGRLRMLILCYQYSTIVSTRSHIVDN